MLLMPMMLNEDVYKRQEERIWKHDYLFTKQNYYTLLFDRESDMDMVGDLSLIHI